MLAAVVVPDYLSACSRPTKAQKWHVTGARPGPVPFNFRSAGAGLRLLASLDLFSMSRSGNSQLSLGPRMGRSDHLPLGASCCGAQGSCA